MDRQQSVNRPSAYRLRFESLESRLAMAFTPVGAPTRISSYDPEFATETSVAMDAAGNFVAVWSEGDGPFSLDHSRLYGRRFDPLGKPLSEPFRLNTLENNPNNVKIKMTADGRFVTVWQTDRIGDPKATSIEIYFRVFGLDGIAAGPERLVSEATDQGFPDWNPDLAINSSGTFVVSWNGVIPNDPLSAGTTHIFARRYDPAGQPLGAEFQVDVGTVCTNADSAVALGDDGGFVVTWVWEADREVCGVTASDQLVRRFDSAGNPVGVIESAAGGPNVTGGSGGRVALLGTEVGQGYVIASGSIGKTFLQQFPKTSPPIMLDIGGDTSVSISSFVASASVVGIGWRRVSTIPVFRLFTTTGEPLTSVIEVAAGTGVVIGPQLAINESSFVASWGTTDGYFFQRYSFNPLAGDVNGDERVNLHDFVILKNYFNLANQPRHQGDLTGDGVVNILDFAELRRNFGRQAAAPESQNQLAAVGAAIAMTEAERNRTRLAGAR